MIIRDSTSEDIPAIIGLLQSSLGETFLKKTEAIWRYKHVATPFGVSPVLVAEEDGVLIGVRAFMQWRWQINKQVWISYRAVDTATHPDYQGKGIFKKLTLQALALIQQQGDCFVFNTPNAQSRPGYLKMGWQGVGKIKVAVVPVFLYGLRFLFSRSQATHLISTSQLAALCENHNNRLAAQSVLFTPKSVAYLHWRYDVNPLQDYVVFSSEKWYVALYIKKHRFFNELRVVESLGLETPANRRAVQVAITRYAVRHRCLLLTTASSELFGFRLYGAFGPLLTFKPLTSDCAFINTALAIAHWHYSLGDLELF